MFRKAWQTGAGYSVKKVTDVTSVAIEVSTHHQKCFFVINPLCTVGQLY